MHSKGMQSAGQGAQAGVALQGISMQARAWQANATEAQQDRLGGQQYARQGINMQVEQGRARQCLAQKKIWAVQNKSH